jgi:hypothetical protein
VWTILSFNFEFIFLESTSDEKKGQLETEESGKDISLIPIILTQNLSTKKEKRMSGVSKTKEKTELK